MSIVSKNLGNGQILITETFINSSHVTSPQESVEDVNITNEMLVLKNNEVSDLETKILIYQGFEDGINIGNIPPIPDTNPHEYLLEHPIGNYYSSTKEANRKIIDELINTKDVIILYDIPDISLKLENAVAINEEIDSIPPPPGGNIMEFILYEGPPLPISQGTEPIVPINVEVFGTEIIMGYVVLKININHSSTEPLRVSLKSPIGKIKELAFKDFDSVDDDEIFGTWNFNGDEADGTWELILHNEPTSSVNVLNSALLFIHY